MPAARAAAQFSRKRSSVWSPPSVALMKAKSTPTAPHRVPVDVALVLGDVDAVHRVLPGNDAVPACGIGVAEARRVGDGPARRWRAPDRAARRRRAGRHASRTIIMDRMDTALGDFALIFPWTIPARSFSVIRIVDFCGSEADPWPPTVGAKLALAPDPVRETGQTPDGRTTSEDDQGPRDCFSASSRATPRRSIPGTRSPSGRPRPAISACRYRPGPGSSST